MDKIKKNFGKIWLQLKNLWKKLIKPSFPNFGGFFCVILIGLNWVGFYPTNLE